MIGTTFVGWADPTDLKKQSFLLDFSRGIGVDVRIDIWTEYLINSGAFHIMSLKFAVEMLGKSKTWSPKWWFRMVQSKQTP